MSDSPGDLRERREELGLDRQLDDSERAVVANRIDAYLEEFAQPNGDGGHAGA